MKKIVLLLTAMFVFAVSSFAMREPVSEEQISTVISEFYPNLSRYYEEGLIKVASLTEETLGDGFVEYNIKYKFVNSYYDEKEIGEVLERQYPNEFILYKAGLIKDVCIFRYVDKETGEIETNLGYNWAFPQRRRTFPHHRLFIYDYKR